MDLVSLKCVQLIRDFGILSTFCYVILARHSVLFENLVSYIANND